VPGLPAPTGPYPASTTSVWRDGELLTGWKRWLVVAARSLDITRAYVRAFFDQHLRGRPQALLDQPSPRYPEVTFCSP